MHSDNPIYENVSAKKLLASVFALDELSEAEQKELQRLTAVLLLKAQRRKNEKSLINGMEAEITTWEHSAKSSGSVAEKIKIAGIIDNLKRELQEHRLRENLAVKELDFAGSNFNLFKVKLAIANPRARRGLEDFRSRMEDVIAHLPNLVTRSGK